MIKRLKRWWRSRRKPVLQNAGELADAAEDLSVRFGTGNIPSREEWNQMAPMFREALRHMGVPEEDIAGTPEWEAKQKALKEKEQTATPHE